MENSELETPNNEASLDITIDSLAENMPEVQEHVIENHIEKEERVKSEHAHLKDKDGNPFDPAIHKTNKEGEPTLSPKGLLIRKPSAGKNSEQKHSHSVIGGQSKKAPEIAPETMQQRATGKMVANLVITLGVAVGGEEWHPVKNDDMGLDEKLMLESAFADYFEATGMTDVPPSIALSIAVGAYALPRFSMPKTKKRVGGVIGWFKKLYINRQLRKHGLKATEADNKGE